MSRWKELRAEWRARRAGRRYIDSNIHRATRDVTGPTGWVFSNNWDELDKHGDAYIKSFDRRVPPSIFVSERDRTRFNQPMPLVERCIEDHPDAVANRVDEDQALTSADDADHPAQLSEPDTATSAVADPLAATQASAVGEQDGAS